MQATPPPVLSLFQRYLGFGLSVVALAVAGSAVFLWASRVEPTPAALAATDDARAWMLLERSLRADAQLPLQARVQTVVFAGNRQIQSESQLARAPQHLAVTYLSGPMKGQASGFSQNWFWRQEAGKLAPYAQVARRPDEMARGRFDLMRQNYVARLQAPQQLDGRAVEVIELRPIHPALGARGPARRVFIDARTGLTLRTESFNYRLQPVSHSTFSDLELKAPAPTAFETPAAIAAAAQQSFWQGEELGHDERAVEREVGLSAPQSQRLPRGFAVDGVGVHRCVRNEPGKLQLAAFTRYTDGLNVLTLFAVKAAPLSEPNSPVVPGDVATDLAGDLNCNFGPGTIISRSEGGGTLMAMGDLPVAVLQRALGDARFQAVAQPTATPAVTPTPIAK